eukprot:TCALIF_10853-PA protein Name:"Protein of unknown function" AED:0.20 eAED:0.38 QI:10/0/0/0.75/0/0/4/0/406
MGNDCLQQIRECLVMYSFEVVWFSGKEQLAVDALSRAPFFPPDPSIEVSISQMDVRDPTIALILEHADDKYRQLRNAVLMGDPYDMSVGGTHLFIPRPAQRRILDLLHRSHSGISKITEQADLLYFWPSMKNDIRLCVAHLSLDRAAVEASKGHTLPLLSVGQPVHYQHPIDGNWCFGGTVDGSRSYIVSTPSSSFQRNQLFLRPAPVPIVSDNPIACDDILSFAPRRGSRLRKKTVHFGVVWKKTKDGESKPFICLTSPRISPKLLKIANYVDPQCQMFLKHWNKTKAQPECLKLCQATYFFTNLITTWFTDAPSSSDIVKAFRQLFSLMGVPRILRVLSKPLSPFNPQSNGHAELSVKIVKSLLQKTDGDINTNKFHFGPLELRNSPREDRFSHLKEYLASPLF